MKIIDTSIPDVKIIEPAVFGDERGFFMETWQEKKFNELVCERRFVQDNHSGSRRGILRGLHYQLRQTQGKLVRAAVGEVFDVAVDIRQGSPTFGKWVGAVLSAENRHQLWVPPGFAHGYYVMSEWAEFYYKATDYYAPEWERGILWNDPAIGIEWLLVAGKLPTLSIKDSTAPTLAEAEVFPAGWSAHGRFKE